MYTNVNTVTKVWIKERFLPVLIVMNCATLLDYTDKKESLADPFEINKYEATVNITTRNRGGDGGL